MTKEEIQEQANLIRSLPLFDLMFSEMEEMVVRQIKNADKRDTDLLQVLALHLSTIASVRENAENYLNVGKLDRYTVDIEKRMQ